MLKLRKISGISLLEIVVAVALTTIIAGAVTAYLTGSINLEQKGKVYNQLNQNAAVAFGWLERDIRSASFITKATPTKLVLTTTAGSITYNFDGSKLTRAASGSTETLLGSASEAVNAFSFSYRDQNIPLVFNSSNEIDSASLMNIRLVTLVLKMSIGKQAIDATTSVRFQPGSLPVWNVELSRSYAKISSAFIDPEFKDYHHIRVREGIYPETVSLPLFKSFYLEGGYDQAFINQVGTSVIDCTNITNSVGIAGVGNSSTALTIDGFSIENPAREGFDFSFYGALSIRNCSVTGGGNPTYNGAIAVSVGGNVTIENCKVQNYKGNQGLFFVRIKNLTIRDCAVSYVGTGSSGSGLNFTFPNETGAVTKIINSSFNNCRLLGIQMSDYSGRTFIYNCETSGSNNWGIADGSEGDVEIRNCKLSGNNTGYAGYGSPANRNINIFNSEIKNITNGIALYATGASIYNCDISGGGGFGVILNNTPPPVNEAQVNIYNSRIYRQGTGVFIYPDLGKLTMRNCLVAESGNYGLGSMHFDKISLNNVSIVNNLNSLAGDSGPASIKSSIIKSNLTPSSSLQPLAWSNVQYSLIDNPNVSASTGIANQNSSYVALADIFTNPANADYSLKDGSARIDGGHIDPIFNESINPATSLALPPAKGFQRCDMGAYGGPHAKNGVGIKLEVSDDTSTDWHEDKLGTY